MAWGWQTVLTRIEIRDLVPTSGASAAATHGAFGEVVVPLSSPAVLGFPTAPEVAPGDLVKSSQINGLVDAYNARLVSGIGDGHRRILAMVAGMCRNLRNSDASGFLHPATLEFLESYQNIDPESDSWPATDFGDPEGINVNAPWGAFVGGNLAGGIDAEADRLAAVPLLVGGLPPADAWDLWTLGKGQRGGIVEVSGEDVVASPALYASSSYQTIRFRNTQPQGMSFGNWQPGPEILSTDCDDPLVADGFPAPINYEIKFTAISMGYSDITFAGTCQPGPDISPSNKYDSHVAWITTTPWAYYVWLNNGTLYALPTQHYVEGPYTGPPRLRRRDSEMFNRTFNSFIRGWRGDELITGDQEPAAPPSGDPLEQWNVMAFDVQRFMTRQYLLAPAFGTWDDPNVAVEYPRWEFTGATLAADSTLAYYAGGTSRTIATRFLGCGWAAKATGLVGSIQVGLFVGGVQRSALTLTDGVPTAMEMFPDTQIAAAAVVTIKTLTAGTWTDGTGTLTVEIAELIEMLPQLHDLALVLRLSAATV